MNNRPILLQGAMEVETEYIKQEMKNKEEIEIYGFSFTKGYIENYPIILSRTEIGVINTSMSTLIGTINFNPLCIINQGIAGSLDEKIHKLDVVIGTSCKNINSYETKRRKKGEGSNPFEWQLIKFTSQDEKEDDGEKNGDKYLIQIIKEKQELYLKGKVFFGKIGSGDIWNKEIDRIIQLNEKEKILCEDMESISAYTVANRLNVPVVGIRVMSDNERLQEEYERTAGLESQRFTLEIVKEVIRRQK